MSYSTKRQEDAAPGWAAGSSPTSDPDDRIGHHPVHAYRMIGTSRSISATFVHRRLRLQQQIHALQEAHEQGLALDMTIATEGLLAAAAELATHSREHPHPAARRSSAVRDESMKRSQRQKLLSGKRSKDGPIPFHRELSAMQMHYDQLNSALVWKNPGRVRSTACHVVLAWLDMEAAFIRFIERTPARLGLGPKIWRERLTLTGSNYLARELLQRALNEMPSWNASRNELRALGVVLRWLHERLQLWSVIELPVLHS